MAAFSAAEVPPTRDDEGITTPYTFFATVGAISRLGATPVFVDIDPATYNLDAAQITAKITTKTHGKLGTILATGPKKMTVYMFEADKTSKSTCSGACAVAWPPVIAKGSPSASGQAASADLGTTTRAGGIKQVTYKGHPLYYFIKDKDDGDAYGQGAHAFGADWYVLTPSGKKVE